MRKNPLSLPSLLILVLLLLAACSNDPNPVSLTSTPTLPTPAASTPTIPPTPIPPRSLVVCLGYEPRSLYMYADSSAAAWSVFEAIYDGPFDTRDYAVQPVILQQLPTLENGAARLNPVTVSQGDEVVDADGNLVVLTKDVRVFPSGCNQADCAMSYTGQGTLEMDQLTAAFTLLPGLQWSDSQPLTAADSVYSYTLAAAPETPVTKGAIDRTQSYQAVDELTVEWVGKPGYLPSTYQTHFWAPLPEHAWGSLSPADLLSAEVSTLRPLGWGPYMIQEWVRGDHISLQKNPNYFRVAEGLPHFDQLVFRFLNENSGANLSSLLAGECDIVDRTGLLDEQLEKLVELQKNQRIQAFFTSGPEWEHLDFGIRPSSYEDGYDPASGDRADIFGDVRTRQAFSLCLDRQKLVNQLFFGQSITADTYLPPQHPLINPEVHTYPFDPAAGASLLEQVGWVDTDGDPATPRLAQGVANVPANTPLTVTYWTTEAELRRASSQILSASLAQCGIGVELKHANPGVLFAPGPEGPIFGRAFDLVQYSWESSAEPACFLYMSSRIPQASNRWVGVNVSGFANPEYDAACQAAMGSALASQQDPSIYQQNHDKVQEIYAEQLPVVPLYLHIKTAASRPDLCGLAPNPTVRSDLWNLEVLDYGETCPQN